jgi:hypothetical protein
MRDRLLAGIIVVPFALGLSAGAAPERGEVAFSFQDPEIVESSGLVVEDGLVLTTNDSGDSGRVFAVDPATGRTVGVTRWSDDPWDVEALAPAGGGEVWVGDIGDNAESRDSVQVARVPVGRGERTVDVPTYDLTYPQGPVNAESLLADPTTGRLYVATKSVFGGRLYEAPATLSADRPNRLRAVGDVLPIATDGAFFPDGLHLVVRDYSQATVYGFPSMDRLATFRLPREDQGEGIAVAPDGSLLVSSEGQHSDVLRVPLPDGIRRALAPATPHPASTPGTGSTTGPSTGGDVETDTVRPLSPWLLTGGVGLAVVVVLLLSLRRR